MLLSSQSFPREASFRDALVYDIHTQRKFGNAF